MTTINDKLPEKGIFTKETLIKIMNHCKKYIKPGNTYYYDYYSGNLKDYKGKIIYQNWKQKLLPYDVYNKNKIITNKGNDIEINEGHDYKRNK